LLQQLIKENGLKIGDEVTWGTGYVYHKITGFELKTKDTKFLSTSICNLFLGELIGESKLVLVLNAFRITPSMTNFKKREIPKLTFAGNEVKLSLHLQSNNVMIECKEKSDLLLKLKGIYEFIKSTPSTKWQILNKLQIRWDNVLFQICGDGNPKFGCQIGTWDEVETIIKDAEKLNNTNSDILRKDTYTGEELHTIPLGLYEIFWKSGGSSLASVGNLHDGTRWIAPINWTAANSVSGRMDKCEKNIEKMKLLYTK
jgi:hypothetical protein